MDSGKRRSQGAALSMLPILIAVSAAKKFGGNPYLAAVIGFVMIHPNLVNAWSVATMDPSKIHHWSVWFGLYKIDQVGYQGHVIPVIIAILLMSKLEKWLHKHVPAMFDLFVTPLVTVLVTGYLTMTVIGPVFAVVEGWVVNGAQALIHLPFGVGGILIGGLYAITVVAGLHHMYNMIEAQMVSLNPPFNTWMPIATAANVAQGAAALAVAVKTKNKKLRSMAAPASMSAFLGITEPAIFGVNVRFMKPFIAGLIGGAAGGFTAAITGTYATAYGITGLFGFLITTKSLVTYAITMAVAFAVAFAVSFVIYRDEADETAESTETEEVRKEIMDNEIMAPVSGKVIPLSEVPDETFASGALGKGCGIEPGDGRVYAPADGVVSVAFETKHAIGITADNGAEILIHVGINTVELNGKYFTSHVTEGQRIKKGDLLLEFDIAGISKKYSTVTPVLITNPDEFSDVLLEDTPSVNAGDKLIALIR